MEIRALASNRSPPRKNFNLCNNKPSWLLSTIADVEERMKVLAINPNEEDKGDTFAERAESYYRKRPQLLALLQDLYNAYLTLSDRYIQSSLPKSSHCHHRRHSSQVSTTTTIDNDYYYDNQQGNGTTTDIDDDYSDVESSLSYQHAPRPRYDKTMLGTNDDDDDDDDDNAIVVSELVMKNVELEVLLDELGRSERRCSESSRKVELQKSLLEVLESERLILLNENARLGYRVAALAEENKGLASESLFLKRKAAELAGCVLRMREDQRVCMLSRKIEDLQAQIYGLEKRNKEYYEQLILKSHQLAHFSPKDYDHDEVSSFKKIIKKKKKKKNEVVLEGCFQMRKLNERLTMKRSESSTKGKRVSGLWERVKSMDLFLCGVNPSSA